MYCIVFIITNLTNDKILIGTAVQEGLKLSDYGGCNTSFKRDVKDIGWENFSQEVLASFKTHEEMFELERDLVNKPFVASPKTYNVNLGGISNHYYVRGRKNNRVKAQVPERLKCSLSKKIKKLL